MYIDTMNRRAANASMAAAGQAEEAKLRQAEAFYTVVQEVEVNARAPKDAVAGIKSSSSGSSVADPLRVDRQNLRDRMMNQMNADQQASTDRFRATRSAGAVFGLSQLGSH